MAGHVGIGPCSQGITTSGISGPGTRRRRGGQPTAALKAEQDRLRLTIEAAALERFHIAVADHDGSDATRWDLSRLGRRPHGRPKDSEKIARQLAEAGQQELYNALLNEVDFPLLWQQQLDEISWEVPGDANGLP